MEIIPQSSVIGAEVVGLDLSKPLDSAGFDALNSAFLQIRTTLNEFFILFENLSNKNNNLKPIFELSF